jgi:signal transduction histidine kinase
LKTPLTSILGFSQILVEDSAGPTQQRAAQVINEEAHRLQRLTLDLLDLSRLESGRLQLRRTMLDLNDLAGRALAPYAELPANASLHFLDRRASGPLWISGDGDRLMQILVNLLDNAVKFCDPEGSVALRTERRGTKAVLTVANTGAAIDPEDLTRVFQRFYRTDHSRATRTGGTGLGLAIVRELVAAHGGQVEARSDDDGWTRFVISLPSIGEEAARPAASGSGEGSATPRSPVEQGSHAPEIPV